MGQAGWPERFGPPSLVVTTGLLIAMIFPAAMIAGPPAPRAGGPPAACQALDLAAAVRGGTDRLSAGVRVTSLLTPEGVFGGRRLSAQPRTGLRVEVALPVESFISAAAGDVIVYGSHEPASGSEVRALSIDSGCQVLLARPAGVVRSAVLDRAGRGLYVHSVAAADRADQGVTRHDLATGASELVLSPLGESEAYGPTFGTELRWSVDGDALAVQSCGIAACRTRILELATGVVSTYDDPPHGQLVGITADTLYTLAACHGSPCALLATDRRDGDAAVIREEVLSASLTTDEHGALLALETAAGMEEIRP